jgi:hypothetical protein
VPAAGALMVGDLKGGAESPQCFVTRRDSLDWLLTLG